MIRLVISVLLDDLDEDGLNRYPIMQDQIDAIVHAYKDVKAAIMGDHLPSYGFRRVIDTELNEWH